MPIMCFYLVGVKNDREKMSQPVLTIFMVCECAADAKVLINYFQQLFKPCARSIHDVNR